MMQPESKLYSYGALTLAVAIVIGSTPALVAQEVAPAPAGTFSVVAFPDTQRYAAHDPKAFYTMTQWVTDNLERQRIAFVTHVGDVVDDNIPAQWAVAVRAMARLDGRVPYGISVGNHDLKCAAGDASLFSAMFPASHFAHQPWYGGQIKNNANSFQTFEVGGFKFIVLHLECNAPDDVLEWADGVLAEHADRRAIVTTHMFLGPVTRPEKPEAFFTSPKGVMAWSKCHRKAGNTPVQLWQKCLSKHKNVFLILCGDQSRTQAMHLTLEGRRDNEVHACLSDYGEGYLRLYRFEPENDRIRVITYSPTARRLCRKTAIVAHEAEHQFTLGYKMSAE